MPEKKLSPSQKEYTRSIIDQLQYSVDLELPYFPSDDITSEDAEVVNSLVGKVFHEIVRKEQSEGKNSDSGLDRKDIRRISGVLINNPSGSKNLFDANHGFNHSVPGYSRLGRNHSNKRRSRSK